MKRIIEKQIKRLQDISKFMEMGNSMFTTCFAFDCFAQAVEHELIYAHSDFMETIKNPLFEESEVMLQYIDYGEDWLKWKEKFQKYARFNDEGGISLTGKWSLWTDEHLHPDKKLQKERDETRTDYLYYKITDYRDKYGLRRKLETLAWYMEQMHELINKLNPQVARNFFDFKYDEYVMFNRKEIDNELDVRFSCIPSMYLKEDTDAIIKKQGDRVKSRRFEQYLQEGYDTNRYFFPNGVLNKEAAGMYLALHTRELSTKQKEEFLKYVYVREKVEEFVSLREALETKGEGSQNTLKTNETNNGVLVISSQTTGRELAIMLAARIATGNYQYVSIPDYVELLKAEYPDVLTDDNACKKIKKRLSDSFKQEELEKVKDQGSLVEFAMNRSKQLKIKNENRELANSLFMKYRS